MVLSYCLYYAGIPQSVVPQRAGVDALRSDLRGTDWLLTDAVPQVGDALIYQNAAGVETVGIVKAVDGDTGMVTVISGAVEGTVAEVAVDPASITGVVSVTVSAHMVLAITASVVISYASGRWYRSLMR